jgi:hypothetical protein
MPAQKTGEKFRFSKWGIGLQAHYLLWRAGKCRLVNTRQYAAQRPTYPVLRGLLCGFMRHEK